MTPEALENPERRLLVGALAISAAGVPGQAWAQDTVAQVAAEALVEAGALNDAVLSMPRGAELSREQLAAVVAQDVTARERAYLGFERFDEAQVRAYAAERNAAVAEQYAGLAMLPPARTHIVPMIVPTPRPQDGEALGVVLMDVFLQALGVYLDETLIETVIEADPDLNQIVTDAIDAISTEEPARVVALFEPLVIKIAEGGWLALLIRAIGPDAAAALQRRLLARLALGFLPLIGPAYTMACIGVAIFNNWDRLRPTN